MPTPDPILIELQGSEDPDALVLLQMAELGADLRKPHEPEFTFEAASDAQAEGIAGELRSRGYDVETFEADEDNLELQVVAKCLMVLDLKVLNQLSKEFEVLAARHNASYDGWGAEIVD